MRLVYLSPVSWSTFAQRPHKFVEWFHARYAAEVMWIEPYPTRLPKLADFRRLAAKEGRQQDDVPAWLKVLYPRALPIEPAPVAGAINRFFWGNILRAIDEFTAKSKSVIGMGKPSVLAEQVLARYSQIPSFYDAMDDFPAFYRGVSRRKMEWTEREIANRVSRIFVSSTELAAQFRDHESKLALVPNACDVHLLPPMAMGDRRLDRPVLGYVGTIGQWFDWPLIVELAEQNPEARVRLIGPVYAMPSTSVPRNVELLPACDHSTALEKMREFSVALIPFHRNKLTASVDPIKYYEYRALGLPIISTSFGEMSQRVGEPGLFFVDGQSNLRQILSDALAFSACSEDVEHFRSANSWSARFDSIDLFG